MHSGSNTPASIAWATGTGMRPINDDSPDHRPVTTNNTPVMRNAPTAAGQPPATAPVAASSAAPGVDQAEVIGMRKR